jgi:hypothetical protein
VSKSTGVSADIRSERKKNASHKRQAEKKISRTSRSKVRVFVFFLPSEPSFICPRHGILPQDAWSTPTALSVVPFARLKRRRRRRPKSAHSQKNARASSARGCQTPRRLLTRKLARPRGTRTVLAPRGQRPAGSPATFTQANGTSSPTIATAALAGPERDVVSCMMCVCKCVRACSCSNFSVPEH